MEYKEIDEEIDRKKVCGIKKKREGERLAS